MAVHLKTTLCFLAAAVLAAAGSAGADVKLKLDGRESNSWGKEFSALSSDMFNLRDCIDDVKFTFTVTVESESTSGKKLYVFVGSSCDEGDNCDDSAEELTPQSSVEVELSAKESFVVESGGCSGSGSTEVWAALLENKSKKDPDEDGAIWAEPITVSWDMEKPSAPTAVEAEFGESKVSVQWEAETEDDNVDVDGGTSGSSATFYIVYSDCSADSQDQDAGLGTADSDGDTDEDTGSDSDSDEEDNDKPSCAEECKSAGFSEGGAFNPSSDSYEYKSSGGDVRDAKVSGLNNNHNYFFGVVAADSYRNVSAISKTVCASPSEVLDFYERYANSGGAAGGKFCFIATYAFGSASHPVVRSLSDFRDGFLEHVVGGGTFIKAYYAIGPALTDFVKGQPWLRIEIQRFLCVLSGITVLLMRIGPSAAEVGIALSVLLGLALGLIAQQPRSRR